MKTLVISTCKELLSENEFVIPILNMCTNAAYAHFAAVTKEMLDGASHIIICGTALADFDYLAGRWSWISQSKKPILGICAGAQVIAKEFGWKLTKAQRIGVQPVQLLKSNPLLDKDANAYFLHSYDIAGGEVIATAQNVPALLKVKDKSIFACVFHPEVLNEEIVRNFLKLPNNS